MHACIRKLTGVSIYVFTVSGGNTTGEANDDEKGGMKKGKQQVSFYKKEKGIHEETHGVGEDDGESVRLVCLQRLSICLQTG